jgi:phenazine biosynthesis protein phzE
MQHEREQSATSAGGTPLDHVLDGAPSFALLHRPESVGGDRVEVLLGPVAEYERLTDLPLPPADADGTARHDLLVLVPYRQIAERGFVAVDDGTPLLAITPTEQDSVPVDEVLRRLPDVPLELTGEGFDISDEDYADLVRRVVADEIGRGEGANFVLRRSFVATITDYTPAAALAVFRRLLSAESAAYWTFVVHTGGRTLVGATPERHVSVTRGTAVMNPISGTYRYAPTGPSLSDALTFLADRKETDELYMVVDEELKMMARICAGGGRVTGPHLKEMARLAHTEYLLHGSTSRDVRDVLRETLFAPTVTGSPLESACRVLAQYEPEGRGYYSGVAALIGRDGSGRRTLDSSILIRTADVDASGRMSIAVGATLVRHSDPRSEVAETAAKAQGVLAAVRATPGHRPGAAEGLNRHTEVVRALKRRNDGLGAFWFRDPADRSAVVPHLVGRHVLVVDAEDAFTAMLGLQLAALGPSVEIRRFDEPLDLDAADLVVVGPGPGDPRELGDPKIAALRAVTARLLRAERPFLSVCLGHQVLSGLLGLELIRKQAPNQGLRREIDVFGTRRRVGFYNTFAALVPHDTRSLPAGVRASWDPADREVHALRGPGFRSMQFHPESVLTEDGVDVLRDAVTALLPAAERVGVRPA